MELHEQLRRAGITHERIAARAGRARVTVTLQLTGRQRLQPAVADAAEALLTELPANLLAQAADIMEQRIGGADE